MEEKKKVFIRGREGRGDEIKDILAGLGGKDIGESCDDDECIYYISHDNQIVGSFIDSELAQVIMDNYKEIELPPFPWKEGDILVDDSNPKSYAVFKEYGKGLAFRAYFFLCDKIVYFDTTASVTHYHLANAEELEILPRLFSFLMGNLNEVGLCFPKKVDQK
jgi:hypothetical protein